jgi:hypothetical protein
MSLIRTVLAAKRIFNVTNLQHLTARIKPKSRCLSTISRFPVPERNTLPEDIQEVMNEVEEKVLKI